MFLVNGPLFLVNVPLNSYQVVKARKKHLKKKGKKNPTKNPNK